MIKDEPSCYSYQDLEQEGSTNWDGVRNYQARNNLRKMKQGDPVLFYHSVTQKEVVGVCRVKAEAFPDPTEEVPEGKQPKWSAVTFEPVCALNKPVSLATIKGDDRLSEIALVKQSRLSVMPITAQEFEILLELAETPVQELDT